MNSVEVVSIILGIVSATLSIVAIVLSFKNERESRHNYELTKDALSKIAEKSALIEKTVNDSQSKIDQTINRIIEETVLPQKEDMGEKFGMMMLQSVFNDPEKASTNMSNIKQLADLAREFGNSE